MIKNFIISGICLLLSIYLFSKYNSGLGAPLGSFRKKALYVFSFIAFIAFIVFLNRGYYFGENQKQKEIIVELKQEINEFDKILNSQITSQDFANQKELFYKRNLIIQAVSDTNVKHDTIVLSALLNQYFELEDRTTNKNDSLKSAITESFSIIENHSQNLDSNLKKERDTYFNILINILSTFIAFVIAFTFKNRILG